MKRFIKYRFLFFILIVTLSGVEGQFYAQNTSGEPRRTIDSLKLALKNAKHDTTRANSLLALGEALYLNKPDSALIFWNQGKDLAQKNANTSTGSLKIFLLEK